LAENECLQLGCGISAEQPSATAFANSQGALYPIRHIAAEHVQDIACQRSSFHMFTMFTQFDPTTNPHRNKDSPQTSAGQTDKERSQPQTERLCIL
jgi:hypothetical protein